MFDLFEVPLGDLAILDCPGGASGVPVRARALGARVVSADRSYAISPHQLILGARRDTLHGNRYLRDHPERYVFEWSTDADDHAARRLAALESFAAHFAATDGRYGGARLPDLRFPDASFDLVLSGHLLCTYPDHLDEAAQRVALRGLVRVCRQQVRVFPLIDATVRPSGYLDGLRRAGAADGAQTQLRRVAYHFPRGADRMLVLDVPDRAAGTSAPAR